MLFSGGLSFYVYGGSGGNKHEMTNKNEGKKTSGKLLSMVVAHLFCCLQGAGGQWKVTNEGKTI